MLKIRVIERYLSATMRVSDKKARANLFSGRVQPRRVFGSHFCLEFMQSNYFCFVACMCDLVHDVETILHIRYC